MKLINPIGREVSSNASANHAVPMACMCGAWSNFSGTRTTSDTCSHCGCNCYNSSGDTTRYRVKNYTVANDSSRATPVS